MFDIFHNADLSTTYDKLTCCLSDSMSTTFILMNDDKTCLSIKRKPRLHSFEENFTILPDGTLSPAIVFGD